MNPILEKIKERGYWKVRVRPERYVEERLVTLAECKQAISESVVRIRGWYYPYYGLQTPPTAGRDYIEQSDEWEKHIEWWRYYQSGQFIQFRGFWTDWHDAITMRQPRIIFEPGMALSYLDILYTLTEIYEFASRLGSRELLGKACHVEVELSSLKGRSIVSLDRLRTLRGPYRCRVENLVKEESLATQDLIARSAELAINHTLWLLHRFNWDYASEDMLREDQQALFEGRI